MLPALSTARMARNPRFDDAGMVMLSLVPEASGVLVTVSGVAEPTLSWLIGDGDVNSW